MRLSSFCPNIVSIACLLITAGSVGAQEFASSVVKVHAVSADGAIKFGSGVVIAPGNVATACHVTRHASSIAIIRGTELWVADSQVGSPTHDLCVLSVTALNGPVARARDSQELRPGDRVVAAGFLGGQELVTSRGTVAALYRYDGGNVIRTSASFNFGSSGGGLFDEDGNLVGILAFKARVGENLRFALPSEWLSPASLVASSNAVVGRSSATAAFWERPQAERPAFLGLAMREAAQIHDSPFDAR